MQIEGVRGATRYRINRTGVAAMSQRINQHDNVVKLGNEGALQEVNSRVRFRRALFSCFIAIVVLVIIYITTPLSRLGVVYFDGLNALTRSDLIGLVDIEDDDFFLSIRISDVRDRIKAHPVVNEVSVERSGINRLRITVVEYEVGACAVIDGEVFHLLTDGTLLHEDDGMRANCAEMMIHGLSHVEVDRGIASLFVRQLMRVEPQIRDLIQSINHEPLRGDIYRFSISMLDGNVVKVTTHTMHTQLSLYFYIIQTFLSVGAIELGETGILHLDIGNFFERFE